MAKSRLTKTKTLDGLVTTQAKMHGAGISKMISNSIPSLALILTVVFELLLSSCTGAQVSSFRSYSTYSTKPIKRAPYYNGKAPKTLNRVGHLPVALDQRLQEAWMNENRQRLLLPLLDEMNKFLQELGLTTQLNEIDLPISEAPDIYLGNSAAIEAPRTGAEDEEAPHMMMFKNAPSKSWKRELSLAAASEDVDHVLFITIGIGEYFLRQKNLLGNKVLELGTGNTLAINWFSDLETPAEVLHVSGALLNKDGKIVRAGAEGIIAKQTGFFVSFFDVQQMLSDKDLNRLLNEELREDLPGQPLKWQVALQNLVAQLLKRDDLILASRE